MALKIQRWKIQSSYLRGRQFTNKQSLWQVYSTRWPSRCYESGGRGHFPFSWKEPGIASPSCDSWDKMLRIQEKVWSRKGAMEVPDEGTAYVRVQSAGPLSTPSGVSMCRKSEREAWVLSGSVSDFNSPWMAGWGCCILRTMGRYYKISSKGEIWLRKITQLATWGLLVRNQF